MNNQQGAGPKWLFRFLKWFCPPRLLEEIEGDLLEWYAYDVARYGEQAARRRLFWHTIRFLRPGILLRHHVAFRLNQMYMLAHFWKVFLRVNWQSKGYAFINIGGLTVGLACAIFSLLWIRDELRFDRFHTDGDCIYSIQTNATQTEGIDTFPFTPGPLADALKEMPGVEASARTNFARVLVQAGDQSHFEAGIYADAALFNIFTLPLVAGKVDANASASSPSGYNIILSEKLARKYFGDENAIGKVLRIDNMYDLKVGGVMKDLPAWSTLQFDFVMPYAIYAKTDPYNQEWGAWTGGFTYVKLHPKTDRAALEQKISKQITHARIWPRWGNNIELFLFALPDWHLRDNFENGKQTGGQIVRVRLFAVVALFILVMACVNFMNLVTARSLIRVKEIAVRKVIGAARRALAWQFLGESIFTSATAFLLALLTVHLLLPAFNTLTGKRMIVDYTDGWLILCFVGTALVTGLIAGMYPALLLSSMRVLQILKGRIHGLSGTGVRKGLVVFQFCISAILVIGAVVVYQQVDYMRNKNLGFDREGVFYLNITPSLQKNFDAFRNQALANASIREVSRASGEPMNIQNGLDMGKDAWPGKIETDVIIFQWLFCDDAFLRAFQFKLTDGRNFSASLAADTNNYIISKDAASRMRLAQPVGQRLRADRQGEIVGLIDDFHSAGLRLPIQPVVISYRPERANLIFFHYAPGHMEEALQHAQTVFKKFEPDFPAQVTFLDDAFNTQYQREILLGKLSAVFMGLALFLSCLGLFGLASFMAERRVKEIGIRKVLGATVSQLIVLLCRDTVVLVAASLVIALPFAWWMVNRFLETYAFRVSLSVVLFAGVSVGMLLLALGTVGYKALRAARIDPVKNLRTE